MYPRSHRSDSGSKNAVSGGPCASEEEARAFLAELRRIKKFAKATHSTWALLTREAGINNDDGQSGAGMIVLGMLGREGLHDHISVVTRCYGGKQLGGDRFRYVQEAVRVYLRGRWRELDRYLWCFIGDDVVFLRT